MARILAVIDFALTPQRKFPHYPASICKRKQCRDGSTASLFVSRLFSAPCG